MMNKITFYAYVVLIIIVILFISWFIYRGYRIDSLQRELSNANESIGILQEDLANKQQAALERDKAYQEIERIRNEKDSDLQKVNEAGKNWLLASIPDDVDSTIPY